MESPYLSRIRQWTSWLIRLRWLAVGGMILLLSLNHFWWRFPLENSALWGLSIVLLVYNIFSYLLANERAGLTWLANDSSRLVSFAYFQTFTDLILLTLILHFSGGVENPFIFCYIFHATMGSVFFSRRRAYSNALLASFLLNSLFWAEYTGLVSHYHLPGFAPPTLYRNGFYIFSLGTVLTLTFLAAAYMISVLAGYLRQREVELEETQERLRERSNRCEMSYAELQEVHREKSEFMRKVAHELRAPLAAIQSCLQVSLEYFGSQITGKSREMIERAEKRSGSLIDLVRDLLNLSRANEFLKGSEFKPLDLRELLESVIELVKANAQTKKIQISTRLGEEDLSLQGDKDSLEEVFTNLLSNAIKYSNPETKVQVQVTSKPKEIEIIIRDQGIGIAAEDMPQLFSEFFRADNAKALEVEGTGLGLALSKKIVELHNGKIEVESELGKGTCFKVKLPR